MPEYFIPYTETQDGRRKLTGAQKAAILERYRAGGVSWSSLAKEYGVSKRSIGFIVNPATLEKVAKRSAEHWRDYQQKGKEWADVQRKTRAKKRRLGLVKYTRKSLGKAMEERKSGLERSGV